MDDTTTNFQLTPPKSHTEHKPWGSFDEYTENQPSTVKILTVLPGEAISLQSHQHRSEWWTILDDKMDVVVGDKQFTAHRGETVFIPQQTKHRAIGLDQPCRWLEISFGLFDPNDIIRYEDKYGRANGDHSAAG